MIYSKPTHTDAVQLNAAVVSVDYAKSPEYPFPHALLQAYTVLQWCLSSSGTTQLGVAIDRRRVAVMGNSAGGNLTASLTLLNAFTKGPCKQFRDGLPKDFRQVAQVLLYPSVACNQLYRVRMANASPQAQAKSLPVWMAEMMEACYLPPGIEKDQIFIAPLLASSSLLKELQPKVPPVSCHVAGLDCLQDEAVQYCRHLEMAGVQVELKEYPEANHGFSHYKEDNKEFCKQDVEECWESVLGFLERAFKH
ncbi:Alpha/beta hydrolase fold-3 [Sporormia fimetaria CBS 119925]|uniref:Alpha/beta hydrolase fold-3 n=1 Tax=Sporormia fimetaria CBS 119925 TaxID=1340428 RepID=A0A6A6UXE0_9PLEO|nr:Alpha/beta hydrolase fold-3 [Sporormia fimetaria CBS 119925]